MYYLIWFLIVIGSTVGLFKYGPNDGDLKTLILVGVSIVAAFVLAWIQGYRLPDPSKKSDV